MKVIIAGSRDVTEINDVIVAMNNMNDHIDISINDITEVVSGTARGVDRLGEQWARNMEIPVHRMPANWDLYGKSAGYRRNEEMAKYADVLVAIWDGQSRGTKHMINLAANYGLKVYVHRSK